MELGCIFASRSINILASVQAFSSRGEAECMKTRFLNGLRIGELLSAGATFDGNSGSNYTGLTLGYMLNPHHIQRAQNSN